MHAEVSLREGEHFKHAPLSEKDGDVFDLSFVAFKHWYCKCTRYTRFDEPIRYATKGVVELDPPELHSGCQEVTVQNFEAVEDGGVICLDGLLTPQECDQIVKLCDAIGFDETQLAGGNCENAVLTDG